MRRVFAAMEEIGGGVKEIRFTGGFSTSILWSQMMSDILGREAFVPRVRESSALGAAAMAALGIGIIPDLAAVKKRIEIERVLHPDGENHRRYQKRYELFVNLYEDSVMGWERLRRVMEAEGKE
jgi:autoinducer 2 (AI-2) kinase